MCHCTQSLSQASRRRKKRKSSPASIAELLAQRKQIYRFTSSPFTSSARRRSRFIVAGCARVPFHSPTTSRVTSELTTRSRRSSVQFAATFAQRGRIWSVTLSFTARSFHFAATSARSASRLANTSCDTSQHTHVRMENQICCLSDTNRLHLFSSSKQRQSVSNASFVPPEFIATTWSFISSLTARSHSPAISAHRHLCRRINWLTIGERISA